MPSPGLGAGEAAENKTETPALAALISQMGRE